MQHTPTLKKPAQRLKDILISNQLAIPLLILIAQQRQKIIFQQRDVTHLKMIGDIFDKVKKEKT